MGMKLQIDNACWLGEDAWFHRGTIRIRDGRIAALDSRFASDDPSKGSAPAALRWSPAARRIDARGLFIVPGLIDAHVHLREPGQMSKEGIANGTKAALKGGVTTVLDMPNTVPPCTTRALLERKRELFARKSRVHYGLFLQAVAGGPKAPARTAGVKIYMARSSALDAVRDVDALEQIFRRQNRVVLHAEDERKFFHGMEKSFPYRGKTGSGRANRPGEPRLLDSRLGRDASPYPDLIHHLQRPRAAIRAALKSIETAWRRVPEPQRPRLVIAHCSTADEIEWVARMKRLGHDVWAETCPHYFLFSENDYLEQGSRLQVNPPLRGEKDRAAIFAAVRDGTIDFVSTDHAPHLPKEKDSGSPPSGIAGIEWFGPILLTLAKRGEISWQRYLDLAGRQAAGCYGIRGRGVLRKGGWADLAFVESNKKSKRVKEDIVTRAAWNPYALFDFSVRIRAMMVNGQAAWVDGRVRNAVRGREVYA